MTTGTILRRFLRFFAWLGLLASAFVLVGTVMLYGPCFAGVADACISGVLLLLPGAFVVIVGGLSGLVLLLTRKRSRSGPG